ncbi:hypothetical protein IV203_032383 [Nitzschia inconspicua]|uniref:Uncharacterized protein n=1 Tax=Nitzschia inconspicua TaxID=303405 RepID=A0A9K3KJE6_9STRA|nr:hypothetical protein IV203_032383 [Nitzschia inconspicua]
MGCDQSTPVAVSGGTRHGGTGTTSRPRTKRAEQNTRQSFGSFPHIYGFYDATLYGGETRITNAGAGHNCDAGGFYRGGDCGGGFGGGGGDCGGDFGGGGGCFDSGFG